MRAADLPEPSPDGPRPDGPGPGERPPAPRRRWARRIAALAAVAIAVIAVAAAALVASLDRPWLKRRVLALVRTQAGIDLDYGATRIRPLSGVTIDGLVVRTPGDLGHLAPELARVRRLEIGWSASSLAGHGPKVERVRLEGVEVTVVSDERGRTSFDAFATGGAPERAPAQPSTPLSRILAEALGAAPPVRRIDAAGVTLSWIRIDAGREADRWTLGGLAAHVEAQRDDRGWRLDASVGPPSGAVIDVARRPDGGSAQLELSLTAQARSGDLATTLDVRIRSQSFRPGVGVRELAHLRAVAVFDAARRSTEITVEPSRFADGVAALEATVAIPDAPGAPVVIRRARGALDLAALLRVVPDGLVPLQLTRGALTWRADGLQIATAPAIAVRGSVAAEAVLTDARLRLAAGNASLASARLALEASGEDAGAAVSLALRDVRLSGPASVAIDRLAGTTKVRGLRFVPGSWLPAGGALALEAEIGSIEARTSSLRGRATSLRLSLDAPLRSEPPFSAHATARASALRLHGAADRLLVDGPAHLDAQLDEVVPDGDRPVASQAVLHVEAGLGSLVSSLRANKHRDALDFALTARAAGRSLEQLLAAAEGAAPVHPSAVSLSAAGRVEKLSSPNPTIEQRSELRVERPGFRQVRADRVTLALRSSGDLWRQRAEGDLTLHPTVGVDRDETVQVTFSTSLDRREPSAVFEIAADGGRALALSGSLGMDRAREGLRFHLDGRLERPAVLLALLEPIPALAPLDLSTLALRVAADGTVRGVVAMGAEGDLRVVPDPMTTAAPQGTIQVEARALRWNGAQLALAVPAATWRAELRTEGARRNVRSTLRAEQLRAFAGDHALEAAGVSSEVSAALERSLLDGTIEIRPQLTVRSLRHDFGAYPVGDLELTGTVRRLPEGVVRIADLRIENRAAGTQIQLRGGMDLGYERRRRFSVRGELQQDLARLWTDREAFEGRGRVAATFRIDSSDLAVFHTRAALRLSDVNARLVRAGASVVGLDGEIPVTANVAVEGRRVKLLRGFEANPFAVQRFADQHPLISRGSFISAASIETSVASIAPLAGNMHVDQNVISLSQLEMGIRGGRVTGQCVIDWDGEDSTVWAHLRATGVQSSHGEPFDGNAAVVLSAQERSIDGRLEILRIGSRHLLDLLDLQDPRHADPATNRIRYALAFGYPDRVRVGFNHGFANLHITFGGVAKLLTVGDLRGIPTGPLVDKVLAPLTKPEER